METVTLEVFAVEMSKAVGFRKMEPTGPAGVRFGLYLPAKGESLTRYGQLVGILSTHLIGSPLFPWEISNININPGDYKDISIMILTTHLQDFPVTDDCRINCPLSLIYGGMA